MGRPKATIPRTEIHVSLETRLLLELKLILPLDMKGQIRRNYLSDYINLAVRKDLQERAHETANITNAGAQS